MALVPIHPFPARMAPELASSSLETVPDGGLVLDPMCGSGTVARAAVEAGLRCIGADVDPLAVLMARAWITPVEPDEIRADAEEVLRKAAELDDEETERTPDAETARFISYWFAPRQESELARIATVLRRRESVTNDALAVALSRIIVSKEMMASLARDTSHSRPHKVSACNGFDVASGFRRSARYVAERLAPDRIVGSADIRRADARVLDGIDDASIDLVLTSPPYLNAIDYLRGHRLALVWLGHILAPLREIRASSVGAERALRETGDLQDPRRFVDDLDSSKITPRHLGWIRRYASDMSAVLCQLRRVIKQAGRIVMVLGNSFLRGATVDNARLIQELAETAGFRLENRDERDIPARRRYLPPPGAGGSALDSRMRTETVLTFELAA